MSSPPSASRATRCGAAMLDEGVQVLDGLWSGERVTHRGKHYAVGGSPWRRVRSSALASRSESAAWARPPAQSRPLGRLARSRNELRQDPDHGQKLRTDRRDGGRNPKAPDHGRTLRGSHRRVLGARRSRTSARLRSGAGDLVARKHPRRARYARRDAGAGEGGPAGGRMRSSNAAGWHLDAEPAMAHEGNEPDAADPSNLRIVRTAIGTRCPPGTKRRSRCAR